MPHQCTECGRTFADGSKEMLSGCPDCGGNKFQFSPSGEPDAGGSAFEESTGDGSSDPTPSSEPAADPHRTTQEGSDGSTTGRRDEGAEPVTDSDRDDPAAPRGETVDQPVGETADQPTSEKGDEDRAQASARSDVVSPEELSSVAERRERTQPPADGSPGDDPADEPAGTREQPPTDGEGAQSGPRPGLDSLREELNDQFESIRIVNPGQYELNLMELYDRQEYIISLKEDGRYVIEMPGDWGPNDE